MAATQMASSTRSVNKAFITTIIEQSRNPWGFLNPNVHRILLRLVDSPICVLIVLK